MYCFRDSYEQLRGSRELCIPQRCPHCLAGLTAPDHEDENADASDADAADDGDAVMLVSLTFSSSVIAPPGIL